MNLEEYTIVDRQVKESVLSVTSNMKKSDSMFEMYSNFSFMEAGQKGSKFELT